MGDEGPRWRVLNHTSGADFESGAAHRARGVNEEQPRGEPPAAYDDWYMYGVRTVHPPWGVPGRLDPNCTCTCTGSDAGYPCQIKQVELK